MITSSRQPRLSELIRSDVRRIQELGNHTHRRGPGWWFILIFSPGMWAVVLYRLSQFMWGTPLRPLAVVVYALNYALSGADLSPLSRCGPGLSIPHPSGVTVGYGVVLGRNVTLLKGAALGTAGKEDPSKDGCPQLGDNVIVFSHACIGGPIEIGEGAWIGANSVVLKPVPPRAVVAGSPGRVVRYRDQPRAEPIDGKWLPHAVEASGNGAVRG